MIRAKRRKLCKPVGTCYQDAGRLVMDQREGLLVHGRVWSVTLKQMIDHAWVELPTGTFVEDGIGDSITVEQPAVVDLTLKKTQRFLPKCWYYALAKAEVVAVYTREEACAQMLKSKHWGPWKEGT